MDFKTWFKNNYKVILIIGVLFLIFNLSQPDTTKKEGSGFDFGSGLGLTLFGGLAIAGGIIGAIPIAIFAGAGMMIFGFGGLGSAIQDWVTPDPTIPWWIWIIVAVVLLFMVFKSKK